MTNESFSGGCLCGAVSYVVKGPVIGVNYCHCLKCRKASGSAFATTAAFSSSGFQITGGHERVRNFESSAGKRRYFCGDCGSPIYSAHGDEPGSVYLRAGTLDGEPDLQPLVHLHTGEKASWYEICLLYTSPSPRDQRGSRMPSSA